MEEHAAMLNAPTVEKLHALKLGAMAAAWHDQHGQADLTALAFDERFGLLVEAEWRVRENKRLARALQEAKLKIPQACVEAIDYPARRELDKALVRQLATCRAGQSWGEPPGACIGALPDSSTNSPWLAPTAATSASSPSSRASTSCSSMTGGSMPRRRKIAATSSNCSTTGTAPVRPS